MSTSTADLDLTTQKILAFVEWIDSFGAKDIDLRSVSVTTAIILLGMRSSVGHRRNIDWDALIHAIVTGIGSLSCIYLDYFASETLTGLREPLRSIGPSCAGPLTSLHRIIPAVTQGYALCDIINGFRLGPAFLAHGVMTLLVMIIFNESNASHLITPMLVMEMSTIILSVLRADFFTPQMQIMSQACFALSFFLFRIVLSPYIYYQIIFTMYNARRRSNGTYGWCFPDYLYYTSLIFGGFFNCLNLFWFTKLIKKINKKLRGHESFEMKEKLDD